MKLSEYPKLQGDANVTSYSFGPFTLVPRRRLLLRDGLPIKIGTRAFDILTLLVERAGYVVSKNELMTFCWPSTYVGESNLKVNIAALRRVLLASAPGNYVATVSGRGYSFIAEVHQLEAQSLIPTNGIGIPAKPISRPSLLVGRTNEISDLIAILVKARCLSVVGSGGIGKTTLALEVVHKTMSLFPNSVFFIDLSKLEEPQFVLAAIAAALGVQQSAGDVLSDIIELLYRRKSLLIFDNCEHVSTTVQPIIECLLRALPKLTILVTSREPLRLSCERVYRLRSLSCPSPHQKITASMALQFTSVELFVACANSYSSFTFSDADVLLVSTICRRLDGIPLAIKAVASKIFAYGLESLYAMSEQELLQISNSERTAPLRQQSMLANLGWSYRLLSDDEAVMLIRLSTLVGRFQLRDAAHACEVIGFSMTRTVDNLGRLTDKSLICVDTAHGKSSYRMPETTRAFASVRGRDSWEEDRRLVKHAALHKRALIDPAAKAFNHCDGL